MDKLIQYYDVLIKENNDPVYDTEQLREYMDKWDGQEFISRMELDKTKSVLEIGVGTGRLAVRTAPLCRTFVGIDISPETVKRAEKNLSVRDNVTLVCGDFLTYEFFRRFDIIYSSLTFMHIKQKSEAILKSANLLNSGGKFVLSTDKTSGEFIDAGFGRIGVFRDDPAKTEYYIAASGMILTEHYETEFADIFVAQK